MVDSNKYLIKFSKQLLECNILTAEEYNKVLKSLICEDERLTNLKRTIESDINE